MKIELKNNETFKSISDFNYSINDCTSCKYLNNCKNDECNGTDYEFVGIKSIEIKEINEDE